jgi:hypothetical protein
METSSDFDPQDGLAREEMHLREIDFRGCSRSDGLFEVSAHLVDRKPHDFTPPGDTRTVPAGAPIHDLGVTLVFDEEMVVRAVRTFIRAYPYRPCPGGGDTLQSIVGLRIGAGWNGEVRKRLPACDTCTHLKELLGPLASAAYQTMTMRRLHLLGKRDDAGRPAKIDSCYAYGATRSLVERLWPEQYRPDDAEKNG